jgi:hypothetical protein
LRRELGEEDWIDLVARYECHQMALRDFRELADHAADIDALDLMAHAAAQGVARELPHLNQGDIGQAECLLREAFAPPAGGDRKLAAAVRGGHVDRLLDARPPGGGREWVDNAGRAEDRDAAQDAEARVQCPLGKFVAPRHRDIDHRAAGRLQPCQFALHSADNHAPRDGIDGGTADLEAEPRKRDDADARSATQGHAGLLAPPYGRDDLSAVRYVGVVASVLDDTAAHLSRTAYAGDDVEARLCAGR